MSDPNIHMVHRSKKIALLEDGTELKITSFYDGFGDECEPHEAVACIAKGGGFWASIDLTKFDKVTTQ